MSRRSSLKAVSQDAGAVAKSTVLGAAEATQKVLQLEDGRFVDYRWTDGRWDLAKFSSAGGKMDWEAWNKARPHAPAVLSCKSCKLLAISLHCACFRYMSSA